tara:strand:+ start:5847 stop:6125 length:279 start_codon:yes stop_codon:yes gene_type:complete
MLKLISVSLMAHHAIFIFVWGCAIVVHSGNFEGDTPPAVLIELILHRVFASLKVRTRRNTNIFGQASSRCRSIFLVCNIDVDISRRYPIHAS